MRYGVAYFALWKGVLWENWTCHLEKVWWCVGIWEIREENQEESVDKRFSQGVRERGLKVGAQGVRQRNFRMQELGARA